MAPKNENIIPPDRLNLYDQLIATNPSIERKGKTMPYTSLNGHMFSYLSAEGVLALRLPENERGLFMKTYNTKLMISHGVVMKEYVEVPGSLLEKTEELKKYFKASYHYVGSLKPKPSSKRNTK